MINEELLKAVCKQIADHPETWNQDEWGSSSECGTTFCLAGHTLMASGRYVFKGDDFYPIEGGDWLQSGQLFFAASDLLGLTDRQANRLFYNHGNDGPAAFLRLVEDVTGVRVHGLEGRSD